MLTYNYCLTNIVVDCSSASFVDETVYGTLGNAERHTLAYKYLVYKMSVDGLRTLVQLEEPLPAAINVTGQTVPTDYVADNIKFPTTVDGWYQLVLWNPNIWDNATPYTAETATGANDQSIIYYAPTDSFYYALLDNTNIPPDDPTDGDTNWQLIEDVDWEGFINNTSLIVNHIHNDISTCKLEQKLDALAEERADEVICGNCPSFKELEDAMILELYLNSMNSANFNEVQFRAEKIAVDARAKYHL